MTEDSDDLGPLDDLVDDATLPTYHLDDGTEYTYADENDALHGRNPSLLVKLREQWLESLSAPNAAEEWGIEPPATVAKIEQRELDLVERFFEAKKNGLRYWQYLGFERKE